LLIADVLLPGSGDGLRLAQAARDIAVPTLLISGHPEVIAQQEAQGLPFLSKPFRLLELLRAIRRLVAAELGLPRPDYHNNRRAPRSPGPTSPKFFDHRAVLATTLNWQPRRDVSLDARTWFCLAPMARGRRAVTFFTAGGAAGGHITCCRLPFREYRGDLMASGTFLGVNHYRFYELDHSDHIEAGYSVECGSDAEAVRAAGRLLENSPAVWQGPGRVIQLRSGMWQRFLHRWNRFARPGKSDLP
jgi:hypothetical protein